MTLVELTIVMVLSAILALVMVAQFVISQRCLGIIGNEITASQEAIVAINHMSRTSRFAISAHPTNPPIFTTYSNNDIRSFSFVIEPGHLTEFMNMNKKRLITYLWYRYFSDGSIRQQLTYSIDNDDPVVIASYVTDFNVTITPQSATNSAFTINLTTQKGNQSVPISTTVYALPDEP